MNSNKFVKLSRRDLIKKSILLSAGATGLILPLIAQSGRTETNPEACQVIVTPPLGEGPFYPIKNREDKDNDLTLVKGNSQRSEGQFIYLYGRVTDQQCRPLQNALVEIWQNDARGRYDHSGDRNPGILDPNFQHWGQCQTDVQGRYEFMTIMPLAYPVWGDWVRPPHIHFHVSKSSFHDLTTQMFFPGDPLHQQDKMLQGLPPHKQNLVIATPDNSLDKKNIRASAKQWKFDIVLRPDPM